MCQNDPDCMVNLHVWFQAPYRPPGAEEVDPIGGHVALEVKQGPSRWYLGWWPQFWTVYRFTEKEDRKNGILNYVWIRRLWQRSRPYAGRQTRYSQQSTELIAHNADEIDSVLVMNEAIGKDKDLVPPPWNEKRPDRTYRLCVPSVEGLSRYVENFGKGKKMRSAGYHFILNNCASVTASALRAGGVSAPRWKIWAPKSLEKFCRTEIACSTMSEDE